MCVCGSVLVCPLGTALCGRMGDRMWSALQVRWSLVMSAHLRASTSCVRASFRHVTPTTLSETEDAQRRLQMQTVEKVGGALMDFVVRVWVCGVGFCIVPGEGSMCGP